MSHTKAKQPKLVSHDVITNQLWIDRPSSWAQLSERYCLWRYQLNKRQNDYRLFSNSNFFVRFTNDYKDRFNRPFYFFTYDKPFSSLYTILPPGTSPRTWVFNFDNDQEIQCVPVNWDELDSKIWLKLIIALCFHEASTNEKERRVCQSKFYVRVKGKENWFTAIEVTPCVDESPEGSLLRFDVEAHFFAKVTQKPNEWQRNNCTYFEQLDSGSLTYLRQIRPSNLESFTGNLYVQKTKEGEKPGTAWYTNGKYEETRSYIIHELQVRLTKFLRMYGFDATTVSETMNRLATKPVELPLHLLPVVQVIDNRINKAMPLNSFFDWLTTYSFPTSQGPAKLAFELVDQEVVDAAKPLLILQDVHKEAFEVDRKENKPTGLFARHGYSDPYRTLYDTLNDTVKQSININTNELEGQTVVEHYLDYSLPRSFAPYRSKSYWNLTKEQRKEADIRRRLDLKLEASLNDLLLKWAINGIRSASSIVQSLPHIKELEGKWGFMTNNTLLTINDNKILFADLTTPVGRKKLREEFVGMDEIQDAFRELHPFIKPKYWDDAFERSKFVFVNEQIIEIERTDVIAMPTYDVLLPIKESGSLAGERSRDAIGVYAGGIWYNPAQQRYIVSGVDSTSGTEEKGHHFYQIHAYSEEARKYINPLIALLCVTFVRKGQYTVLPFPFDLIRLHQELISKTSLIT